MDEPNVKYHNLILSELFANKDYPQLKRGLDKLFSEYIQKRDRYRMIVRKYEEFIQNSSRVLWGGKSLFITIILSEKHREKIQATGPFMNLPHFIYSIELWLLNLLPSIIALIAFCELEPEVSKKLNQILKVKYEEEKVYIESRKGGYLPPAPEQIKRGKVKEVLFSARKSVENYLYQYFPQGVFLSEKHNFKELKCPAIELFSVDEISLNNDRVVSEWIDNNDNFIIRIMGCLPMAYKHGGYLLFPILLEDKDPTLRIIGSMKYFSSLYKQEGFYSPEIALSYRHRQPLMNNCAWFSLTEFIKQKIDHFIDFREDINFNTPKITSYKKSLKNINNFSKTLIQQYDTFNNKQLEFNRFSTELTREMEKSEKSLFFCSFTRVKVSENNKTEKGDFYNEIIIQRCSSLIESLRTEIELLKDKFQTTLQIANMQANYLFSIAQKKWNYTIIFLTVIITLLTVFLVPWNELYALGKVIWALVKSLRT